MAPDPAVRNCVRHPWFCDKFTVRMFGWKGGILRATKPTLSDSGALCECRYDDYLAIDGCANPSPTQSGNELIAAYEYFALHKASRRKLISSRNLYQYVKLTLSSQTEYGAASR